MTHESSLSASAVIRAKRDGQRLNAEQIASFVSGLSEGHWSDAQAAALAMAILLRGMDNAETEALTAAMAASGERLDWRVPLAGVPGLHGPFLDKHSSGGVGDKVSLLLAPMVAACGGIVPMISGRGLGHTGGTLDKLESLAGYRVDVDHVTLAQALRLAGCAIVGASARLAPADRRLYAIRDVTATVESLPLIVASILSKKLAAGLDTLVLDVKCGNGAFCTTPAAALELAQALVRVAQRCGLPARAVLSDMHQLLGLHAGNALEVAECMDFFTGQRREPRLLELTLELAGQMLHAGGLCSDVLQGRKRALQALDSGAAAERFERMVAALGGPSAALQFVLPRAPVQRVLQAEQDGTLWATDTRELGDIVVGLGGGRRRSDDRIDPRVGLADVLPLGSALRRGDPLLYVHAASEADAEVALQRLRKAFQVVDAPLQKPLESVVLQVVQA